MNDKTERYLTSAEVRARFGGISQMSLWRWLNDPKLAFPQPLRVNRRRLFKEQDVIDWEARQRVEAA